MEINDLPDKELKVILIKTVTELERRGGRMYEQSENFNKEAENTKRVSKRSHGAEDYNK